MKLFKLSLLSLALMFSFALSHVVRAEDKTSTPAPVAKSVMTAMVNIENPRIIGTDKNTFTIGFTLSNGTGIQTGVKYGVQLVKDGTTYISDEKVYDESLSLAENSKVEKEVVYTAPAQLSGNYTLYLASNNENSFPFAVAPIGKVKLTATKKSVSIANDSCYITVEGEKGSPHYTLTSGVDIGTNEALRLTCTATNNTDAEASVSPFFETRYFGAYGAIASQTGGTYDPITFTKGQKKTFSVLLPKGISPQFYAVKMYLVNSSLSSNTISAQYIIRGVTATVQNASLDKDFYAAKENGIISVLWQASAGNFARSGNDSKLLPKLTIAATIKGEHDLSCVNAISQPLTRDLSNPATLLSFTTKMKCVNPTVSITISDENGVALDKKDFSFTSPASEAAKAETETSSTIYMILGGVVLLLILGFVFSLRKKKDTTNIMPQ